MKSVTITVSANEDEDDCLTAAAAAYVAEHPAIEGYDLAPQWGDDDRTTVALTVPSWVVRADLISAVSSACGDDGTGDIGVTVDQCIADGITDAAAIIEIVREAMADAAAERAAEVSL